MSILSFSRFIELNNNQWLGEKELKKLQWKKLKSIIEYAYNNVPFYSEKFRKAKVTPFDIKKESDLLRIPVTTKKELRENFPIVSKQFSVEKLHSSKTSGSTGEPVKTFYDNDSWIYAKYLVKLRARLACGMSLLDKVAVFDAIDKKKSDKKSSNLSNILLRKKTFSVFNSVQNNYDLLENFRPHVLEGYPSYLNSLADFVKKKDSVNFSLKMIFTSAEMLDVKTREKLEKVFDAPVFDIYGSTELKEISWECDRHEGYHINSDAIFTEFIKDNNQISRGETGEIVCTSLYNKAMPLIRYAVGDMGIQLEKKCSCGRSLPLMTISQGRVVDSFLLPNGMIVSPYLLTTAIENTKGLLQFQIIQEKKDLILVKVIVDNNFTSQEESFLKSCLLKVVGKEVDVEVKMVDIIPRSKTGKYRVVYSKVKK